MKTIEALEDKLERLKILKEETGKELKPLLKLYKQYEDEIPKIENKIKRLEKLNSPIILEALKLIRDHGNKLALGTNYIERLVILFYEEYSYDNIIKTFEKILPLLDSEDTFAILGYEGKDKTVTLVKNGELLTNTYKINLTTGEKELIYTTCVGKDEYKKQKEKNNKILAKYGEMLSRLIEEIETNIGEQ